MEGFRLFSKHQLYKDCNCCKTGIEVSKYTAVNIERTVAGHNHDILQQCIFDVHWASTRVKLAKIYTFVHRNLFAYTEN